jgi:heavy metal sensor kinase
MTPEGGDHIFRLLAATVDTPAGEVVLVAARSLEDRQEALAGMIAQFSLWGPLTVLMSSLLAYVLAGAALRPVEAMRREAEAISVADLEARLPVPSSNDEIASLGSTLNEMLARLESSIQHERAFLADASHDLRTPLSLLKIELELALRQPRSAEELLGAVQSAACETDRLVALADDLLILASADQGSLPLHRARLSVVEVTESVVSEFRERAEREQRPLAVRGSTGLEIEADKSRLEQALRNLVENSLRYGEGPIEVCVERRGNEVRLHVRDEGPGFALDFLPRAFDRFTRADPARTGEGSGLGLAIAQAIAESHGGSAGVGNRGTGGADVWLAFPAYPAL